jgi:glycosyltransferase involved in cell wall biosynthesis
MNGSRLSVVVLTMNEENKIGRCLEAISPRYPRIIVDSGSTDGTLRIAASHGCAIVANSWPGFAAQRNFALEQCGISTPWVLFVDADEIFPPRFFEWFEAELAALDAIDAVMVPSILYLRGRRLSHAPGYPIYHPRLVHKDRVRFLTNHTGHGEGVPEDCRVIRSDIPYDHYFYDGELLEWMHRHVEKAALEVRLQPTRGAAMTRRGRLSVLIGRSLLRIPARFLYHFVLRGGFLDGRAGLEFSLMFTWYEVTIYVQACAEAESPHVTRRGTSRPGRSR